MMLSGSSRTPTGPITSSPPAAAAASRHAALSLRQRFGSIRDGSYRIGSLEELLDTFVAPLWQLHGPCLPRKLSSCVASTACTADDDCGRQLDAATASAAQGALLQRVVVDWGPELEARGLLTLLLCTWFFGSSTDADTDGSGRPDEVRRGAGTAIIHPDETLAQRSIERTAPAPMETQGAQDGVLQLCSLRTLSVALSAHGGGHGLSDSAATHPATRDAISMLCRQTVDALSLATIFHAVQLEPNRAKRSLSWAETVRLALSLPDRMANFNQGEVDEALRSGPWLSIVVTVGLVDVLLSGEEKGAEACSAASELLVRMDRAAFISPSSHTLSESAHSFWPSFIVACHRRILRRPLSEAQQPFLPDAFVRAWVDCVARCPSRVQERIDAGIFTFINGAVKRSGLHQLVAFQERGKPGREGTALFSGQSTALVGASCRLLLSFCPLRKRSPPGPQNSAAKAHGGNIDGSDGESANDDDGNGEYRSPIRVFERVALAGNHPKGLLSLQFEPAMGWLFSAWLESVHNEGLLSEALEATIKAWSSRDRIRGVGLEQEQYLTLLLVGLLASQKPGAPALTRLASSVSFLDGVSCHLEHSDPHVRRTGMLVAEIVSSKSKAKASAKSLSFGRATWDGTGQGREEARVIRAFHDAWTTHCQAIDEYLLAAPPADAWKQCLETLGLVPQEEGPALAKFGHMDDAVGPQRHRAAPATVRLPPLRPPPARKAAFQAAAQAPRRPLIMSLSDEKTDDGDSKEPLQMFSSSKRGARRPTARDAIDAAASSASTGDENSSDDDDEADEARSTSKQQNQRDDMTRLAADLSEMTHDEAAKLTRNAGLGAPSAPSAGDFDATREAHAPDFSKKKGLRPPVYIYQLGPLLKSDDRDSIKLGLKSCADLIRRKVGWGGEIEENAVDLVFALCGLQNNFSIRQLDERRTNALTALVVASPRTVGGCLTEQFFNHQYSMVQKLAMLNALAQGALEIAGRAAGGAATVGAIEAVDKVAGTMTHAAIARAREEGERRVPVIQRSKNLSIAQPLRQRQGAMITPISSSSRATTSASTLLHGQGSRNHSIAALPTVLTKWIRALLLRLSAHLTDHQTRLIRRRGASSGGSSSYMGTNTSGLFSSTLLSALFDTTSILLDLCTSSPSFRTELSSLCLETCLSILTDPSTEGEESGRTKIHASTLSLVLIVLDRNAAQDDCQTLLASSRQSVDAVAQVAEAAFAVSETRRSNAVGRAAVGADEARVARTCAAILLLMDQMRDRAEKQLRQRLGVLGF